jgi:uncharacterized Fe-S cluster protein YjdI
MRPKTKKIYENDRIRVIWTPDKCTHSGNCVRGLHKVFDAQRRPWVDIDAADVEDIKRVIDTCPSGALSYELRSQSSSGKSAKKRSPAG